MKKIHAVILCAVWIGLCVPQSILAIGVSATPPSLSLKTTPGAEVRGRFTVTNPSKEVGLFEVYPEEFEESITLIPSRFVLEAGEKREVTVSVARHDRGIVRTVIAVEVQPLGVSNTGIGGGVRLPLLVEIVPGNQLLSAVFSSPAVPLFALINLGALTVLFLIRRVLLSTLKRLFRGGTL